jgi:anti-anti-sigma factor
MGRDAIRPSGRAALRGDGERTQALSRNRFPRSVDVDITNSNGGRVIDITVRGELDAFTLPAFEDRILSLISVRQPTLLRVDLSGVAFGGAGLVHTFVTADELAREFGGELVLVNLGSSLRRVFGASTAGRTLAIDAAWDQASSASPIRRRSSSV